MTTGERMKQRRKELGFSAEKVAERLGVSPATIYRYERGDIEKVPGDSLGELAKILQTTPAYLMGWEEKPQPAPRPIPKGFEPMPEMVQVPLIGSIACGTPITAEQNVKSYIGVPAAWHADFALECHGDSMAPTICDGDVVCIRSQPEVEQGQIAAVRIGEEATLKHCYYQNGVVQLIADNPSVCPPLVYTGPDLEDIEIEGLAVGFCRGLV